MEADEDLGFGHAVAVSAIGQPIESSFFLLASRGLPAPFQVTREPGPYAQGRHLVFFPAPDFHSLNPDLSASEGRLLLADAVTPNLVEAMRDERAVLAIDLSNEAPTGAAMALELNIASLRDLGVPLDRVYFLSTNRTLGCGLSSGPKFIFVDIWARTLSLVLSTEEHRARLPRLVARLDQPGRARGFLSLNATPRPHRVAHMACLLADGLVSEPNLVSWGGWEHEKAQYVAPYALSVAWELLEGVPSAREHLEAVSSMSAVRLDDSPLEGNALAMTLPYELYERTLFSVVTESSFDGPAGPQRVTEKSLKSLALGHFPVVIGNLHSLELIQEYGFDGIPELQTWSYDAVEQPAERLARSRLAYTAPDLPASIRDRDVRARLNANAEYAAHSFRPSLWDEMFRRPLLEFASRVGA